VRELPVEELTRRLETLTGRTGLGEAVAVSQDKISTMGEFWPLTQFLFDGPVDDPAARERILGAPGAAELLGKAADALGEIEGPWTVEAIQVALDEVADREGVKRKAVFQPLRVALAGTTISPGIYETVAVLGREETLARVDAALNRVSTSADTAGGSS
jgi:glutamyl/glutaminyl-tRNA synthetase